MVTSERLDRLKWDGWMIVLAPYTLKTQNTLRVGRRKVVGVSDMVCVAILQSVRYSDDFIHSSILHQTSVRRLLMSSNQAVAVDGITLSNSYLGIRSAAAVALAHRIVAGAMSETTSVIEQEYPAFTIQERMDLENIAQTIAIELLRR